jgi:hypothetical protein
MSVHRVGASAPRDRRRVAPHKPWRERRWPSFIIWRWAGPAQVGWTPCPQRVLLLLLLPHRPRHRSILKSRPRVEGPVGRAGHRVAGPAASPRSGRPRAAAAGSRPAKGPRRARVGPPRSRASRPSGAAAARPARAPVSRLVREAGSPLAARALAARALDARALDARPRGSGPRRGAAAGAVSPAGPGRRRSLSAQCG